MITIKQRKVCGNCRAFGIRRHVADCSLGYDVDNGKVILGSIVNGIPKEPCPTPLTVSEYFEATKNYRK